MITVGHERSSTPPPEIRPGLTLNTAVLSPSPSSLSSFAILSPTSVPATTGPSRDPRVPRQSTLSPPLAVPSVTSPPPLETNGVFSDQTDPQAADLRLDMYDDVYFDDEGLSSVEKIYLFSRSKAIVHRVFISRSLHTFLTQVTPLEAVEYVLPLLNGLATDEEEAVKEALVTNLVAIMWWFFENCRLIQEEPPEEINDPPLLPVQTFTPILGSLLIDPNTMVCGPARYAVVESLNRLHTTNSKSEDRPTFGPEERHMLEREIIHQVIIGMGRLDTPSDTSHQLSPPASTSQATPTASTPVESSDYPLSSTSSVVPPASTLPIELSPITPDLSPGDLSVSPASPPLQSPPSQEPESQISFASASPRSSEDMITEWVPQTPHPSSEATFEGAPTDEGYGAAEEAWMTAEGKHSLDLQDDASEQAAIGRCSSMSLIATVTANATLPEETTRAFTAEVARIGKDPLYWVRREASFALGALAKVVPTELVLFSLLPLFDALTHDTVWHVRHSAIFALPGILARLTPQHRRTLALDTLFPLARDVAPTVRSGVLEVLGEVIHTFHEDEFGAPTEIVTLFVGVSAKTKSLSSVFESDEESPADPNAMFSLSLRLPLPAPEEFFGDPARALITSFNYPAVALSLGPQRWDEVRAYYLSLTRDKNLRVRRTIAAGLGEMARILGDSHAQRDLLDVWEALAHDAEDGETRLRALRGVNLFVGALNGAARAGVVTSLVELWDRWLSGWRERECLAGQLAGLAGLAEGQGEVVRTLLARALVDNVAAVREVAISAVFPILRAFEVRPHLADAVRGDLQSLACADSCRRRVTYVACYRSLLENEGGDAEVARDDFWERLILLSRDAVVDVRIGVARLLGLICDKFYLDRSSRPARIAEVVRRLGRDPSRDVRAFVEYLLVTNGWTKPQQDPRPTTPPILFATFSRPPPKTPPLGAMTERMQDLGLEDSREHPQYSRTESTLKAHAVLSHKENDGMQRGEAINTDFSKPLASRRRWSGDFDPS